MKWLLAIGVSLLLAGPASALVVLKESRIALPSATVAMQQERQQTIQQITTAIDVLRARTDQVKGDDDAVKERRKTLEGAIVQLQKHQTAAQANAAVVPAVFTTVFLGEIGRVRVPKVQVMQLVDEKSVLVKGRIGDAEEQVVLVRGVKTEHLVDTAEYKQMFHVTGQHKYKSGGKELEAPIIEPFDAAEFAGK